ncbi:S8 family peptidase [Sphingomonas bacterium]|uniref:S8 family peptidase n=1 Tax=Sphingomonas bacterium TaxID=1895847 RepID=UPI001575B612|nr:S8 family peptidase [Sphingomonas bacterium]
MAGASLLMLSACGGGGGGGVNAPSTTPIATTTPTTPTPTPTTPTPTTPTPTPPVVTINYNDAEYQRSNATVDSGAIAAYNSGYTGTGQMLAIVDSGIATVGTEFTGRVLSASRDFGGNGNITDVDGHGTAVAATAAAARDGSQITGVAFNANLLVLRTDTAGSCAMTDGCSFNSNTLATAVDYARTNGAKVINMSLGGDAMPANLAAAVNRATAAGIIIVISAGNDANAQPEAFAQVANTGNARGLVIIAGAHDSTGAISSFSNKAGTFGDYYLTALGTAVRAFNQNGTAYLYSGTSFSAPEIAGAAILLGQAFPNLTPAQIVALLYSTATDAGASGVDSVFGHGLLNLARAFQPAGTTSLAGSAIPITDGDTMTLSSAMGDAKVTGQSAGQAVVLDSYGRAFTMNVANGVARIAAVRPLRQGIAGNLRTSDLALGPLSVSTTLASAAGGTPWNGLALGRRGFDQGISRRPVASSMVARISPRLTMAAAYATSGQTLAQRIDPDAPAGSFLAARAPDETPGFSGQQAMSLAARQSHGRMAIGFTAERGTLGSVARGDPATPAYTLAGVRAERRFGALTLIGSASTLIEEGTVLGARLASAMGRSGAATRYFGMEARYRIGNGWSLRAAWRQGWTHTASAGVLLASDIASRSAALDLTHLGRDSRFGVRLALPPRVTGGGFDLWLPTSYDYASGAIGYSTARIGLTPQGQEQDIEANYGTRIAGGWIDANLFLRRQPGNFAAAGNDLGTALRYSLSF